jgi:CheY-specific phosphatase CheX
MSTAADNLEALRQSRAGNLQAAAQEVFSMMVGTDFTLHPDTHTPVAVEVTGMVGIAGALSATFSLACSINSASKIASQMLGVAVEEAEAQKSDAIGEICNMVAGQFKAKIGLEAECMLSVPTIVTGKHYELHSRADYDRISMSMLYHQEPLLLTLDVRKQ